jgi:hypothetical protein
LQRLGAAAQDRGVAGLQAEGGDVDGHIWSRFVDDADHADGDAALAQTQPVGQPAALEFASHRVGQFGHAPRIRGQRGDAPGVEHQPVEQGGA